MQSNSGQRRYTQGDIATIAFLVALLPSACSREAGSPAPTTTPPPVSVVPAAIAVDKATAAARMQECRVNLEAGLSTGLVRNASVDNGRPKLWVGPAWRQSTSATKEALARDAACFFLSGDESRTIRFSVYDDDDREVAVWNLSQLVTW